MDNTLMRHRAVCAATAGRLFRLGMIVGTDQVISKFAAFNGVPCTLLLILVK